jgi:hypothetical protein
MKLLQEQGVRFLGNLQIADVPAPHHDDANLRQHELPFEFFVLARVVPAKQALGDPTHSGVVTVRAKW